MKKKHLIASHPLLFDLLGRHLTPANLFNVTMGHIIYSLNRNDCKRRIYDTSLHFNCL